MKSLKLNLENCYGIRKLNHTFSFEERRTALIYAPNGSMKSSFANTFRDVANGEETRDLMFSNRETVRKIVDESENDLKPKSILVVGPIEDEFVSGERTSMLLVNIERRTEYQRLTEGLKKVKERFGSYHPECRKQPLEPYESGVLAISEIVGARMRKIRRMAMK